MGQPRSRHGKLDRSIHEVSNDLLRICNLQGDDMMSVFSPEASDQSGQQVFARDRACPQRELSTDTLRELTEGVEQFFPGSEDPYRIAEKDLACLRETDVSSRPVKEAKPQHLLEEKDMPADRRLGEKKVVGRL